MTASSTAEDRRAWWASLKHGGLLIAPSKIAEFFPEVPAPLPARVAENLRRDVTRVLAQVPDGASALLDTVLHDVLELGKVGWSQGSSVDKKWSRKAITGETIRPRRLWEGPGIRLPIFLPEKGSSGGTGRLGVGRSRRDVSRVIEWLRNTNEKIGILTNGRQWRLIHAGPDYDAWCEWDIDLWFEEGAPSAQVLALRALLCRGALESRDGGTPPLLAAIAASRRVEAELSSSLGERVRRAVELLIQVSGASVERAFAESELRISPSDVYIAASRMVMRCVVVLFAEARDLLPRSNALYNEAYSLQALREQLLRAGGGRARERLCHTHGAWPRVLSLFRLIHDGSSHPTMPIHRYGGALFRPGARDSEDPILRALSVLDSPENVPSDADVSQILDYLSLSKVRVRQGKGHTWVDAPVDFSNLSSEYIGILYEGLLDFELRRAPADDPVVFLNVGDQPALPFSRLDELTEKGMKDLLEKMKKSTKKRLPGDDSGKEEDSEAEEEEETTEESEEDEDEEDEDQVPESEAEPEATTAADPDVARVSREKVLIWARKAAHAGGLVRPPRGKRATEPRAVAEYEKTVEEQARGLVQRLVLPGQWYLVRWGGTRKGAGTFYTKPQLAGPTARRTLEPLVYEPVREEKDEATGLVRVLEWSPRRPQEILAIKVCDPAMGSGSFLVSALRYLTDALWESLNHHGAIQHPPGKHICRLPDGSEISESADEPFPVPGDRPDFESRMKARLKRYVVERCLYGIDIDPLAVELARVALWVETMATDLPMTFLDHKLKCGNALVGCWFDRFQDYPIMAWEREGGDKGHERFVNHFRERLVTKGTNKGKSTRSGDVWTQAIKDQKPRMDYELRHRVLVESKGDMGMVGQLYPVQETHEALRKAFEELHQVPVWNPEAQERKYKDVRADPRFEALKHAFDTWCAIWFWPGDKLDLAPGPGDFLQKPEDVPSQVRQIVKDLEGTIRFFHWELEFPDVFNGPESGFDAVIGNPPWEVQKPNSKEFFSNIDPLYRSYGKQEALAKQAEYFETTGHEDGWLAYCARLKALSNWTKSAACPWGDLTLAEPGGRRLHPTRPQQEENTFKLAWKSLIAGRKGYSDPDHPFLHQGSADVNTYKMFLEAAHALCRKRGQFGLIVPSGIYTDKGSTDLRKLLLERCSWEWVFAFENREKIFDIDSRFKFCPVIARKGGETRAIRAAFMRHDLGDWVEGERHVLAYPRERVEEFSPRSRAILEIRSPRDLEILQKLYANGVLLGDKGPEGWGIEYATEFHMTNDSKLFPPRPTWEAQGYRSDEYGHWLKGDWKPYAGHKSILKRPEGLVLSVEGDAAIRVEEIEDVAVPLYQGVMVSHMDPFAAHYFSGAGNRSKWIAQDASELLIGPQFLMARSTFRAIQTIQEVPRVSFRDVTNATNARTIVPALVPPMPCGNVLGLVSPNRGNKVSLVACLSALSLDWAARQRIGGTHLNLYIAEELPLLGPTRLEGSALEKSVYSLNLRGVLFADEWQTLAPRLKPCRPWKEYWALTPHERIRLRSILDAVVAELYGLDISDFAWILRDCDHPKEALASKPFTRTLDPKGFWRVDKGQDPELRHTVLSLVAFHELKKTGLDAFLALNDGEGWMLPETLRLSDYGLGHDARAKEPQPVRARLGEKFLPWQLEQSVEESWEECRRHAELIERIVGRPAESGSDQGTQGSAPTKHRKGTSKAASPRMGNPPGPAVHRQLDLFEEMGES